MEKVSLFTEKSGHYKTEVQFPRPDFSALSNDCLGYWIGYIKNDSLIATNCLRAEPFWMKEHAGIIGGMEIKEITLPGTHDTGAYSHYKGSESENLIVKYAVCQDEDIWNQLVYGIRVLDIRVGYYPLTPEKFWLVHGITRWHPLEDGIQHVKNFLSQTNEIVIFDIGGFETGFDDEIHDILIRHLEEVFGEYLVPKDFGTSVTLNELWDMDKRLILGYGHDKGSVSPYMWEGVSQKWGNVRETLALQEYLADVMSQSPYNYVWSSQAELTPTTEDVILDHFGGLRNMADMVNREVTAWFRDLWWKEATIINVDFFHGSDVVAVAIQSNQKKYNASKYQNFFVWIRQFIRNLSGY